MVLGRGLGKSRPGDVNDAVGEEQAGVLDAVERVKRESGAGGIRGRRRQGRRNKLRSELVSARGDIDSVEALEIGIAGAVDGERYEIEGVAGRVDDGSAGDADERGYAEGPGFAGGDVIFVRGEEADAGSGPQGFAGGVVGIEGVERVVFRGDEEGVVFGRADEEVGDI